MTLDKILRLKDQEQTSQAHKRPRTEKEINITLLPKDNLDYNLLEFLKGYKDYQKQLHDKHYH